MATLLEDQFTDANGTNLTAHTMNVGPGWTQSSVFTSAYLIQSNQARVPTGIGVVHSDSGQADYTATIDAVVGMTNNDTISQQGFVFRYQDDNNYWLAVVAGSPNTGRTAAIFEVVGGSFNSVASSSVTAGYMTTGTLTLVVSGATVSLTLGGGWSGGVSYGSMGTFLTETDVGLWGRDQDGTGVFNFDNFLVTGGAAPTGNPWNYYAQEHAAAA